MWCFYSVFSLEMRSIRWLGMSVAHCSYFGMFPGLSLRLWCAKSTSAKDRDSKSCNYFNDEEGSKQRNHTKAENCKPTHSLCENRHHVQFTQFIVKSLFLCFGAILCLEIERFISVWQAKWHFCWGFRANPYLKRKNERRRQVSVRENSFWLASFVGFAKNPC